MTVRPELAVGATVIDGVVITCGAGLTKVIVWVAWLTANVRVTGVAAL